MCGQIALQEIDTQQELLVDLAKKIWANPEVGYQEVKASEWTAQVLEEAGFQVERGCAGVPTSLRAVWGSGKPVVGFLGEYDALYNLSQTVSIHPEPVVEGAPGHGCGHNLMAPACVGAVMGDAGPQPPRHPRLLRLPGGGDAHRQGLYGQGRGLPGVGHCLLLAPTPAGRYDVHGHRLRNEQCKIPL